MAVITGGTVIWGNVIPGAKPRIPAIEGFTGGAVAGADPLVQVFKGSAPANGDLAVNPATGYIYERQAGTNWVRVDTL